MGDDRVYAEEGPVRETTIDGFWIDPHEVTNRQFAEFVAATGYVTIAEQPIDPALYGVPVEQIPPELLLPGSAVFTPPEAPTRNFNNWWAYMPGANWKKPHGPDGPDAMPEQPVVHLGWDDMSAYARWKGGRLPTEAEWEYAAKAGASSGVDQPGHEAANTWQGQFPARNTAGDGFAGIAPVGCFAPNAFGLYDMVGNAWEVTADFYRPGHNPGDTHNPTGPSENEVYDPFNPGPPARAMKGGSFLCAPNYCMRYRPAARQASDPGLGASNVGFRLAYDTPPTNGDGSKPRAQPNIVFILLDDLRYDGMGFLNDQLHTPNIDALARGGAYFPNTVVTTSLCSPSRATILTGMTTRNHGIVDNTDSSEEGLTFFPAYLQQAGYQTGYFGKWHMGAATDAPRPGFDKWVSFAGQGNYYPWSGRRGASLLNVDGVQIEQQGYITDELTQYALDWLETGREPGKPFFLYLSHKAVHSDPLPASRHEGQYDDVNFDLPASAPDTPENRAGKPMWVHNQRNTWHGIDFFYNSDMPMTEYLRFYFSTLSAVDDSVGRILAWLRENGLEEDTLIVFTSDNGFLFGDHGLIDKRNAYQPSVLVPFIAYQPGTIPAGTVNRGRIRNLDFAPTFLELAGAGRPEHFEGHSAWPLISGEVPETQWIPDDFIYEYYWEWTFPMTPGTFSITRGDLKYIQYYGIYDIEELYDLAADPNETRNLINDPAYLDAKIELRQALYDGLADNQQRNVIPYSQRRASGSVRRRAGGTRAADFPEAWYVEPNRLDRLDDILPDSRAKQEAHNRGEPFVQAPIVGQGNNTPNN